MNTTSLIGRLTKDIDLKYTSSGKAVGSFTLAVNRNFKNQQGEYEADFILCQIWGKAAESLANFTRKGSKIGIDGRIQTRNYENQQGQRVYITEVVVNNFHLLDPKESNQNQNYSNNNYQQQSQNNQYQQGQGNFNQNYSNNYQQAPFVEDSRPVEIAPDDLPF